MREIGGEENKSMKCSKCGIIPKESDRYVWRCNSCKKVYKVSLKNIQGFAEKKGAGNTAPLLRCKECGVPLDDGTETIAWKCSCGNVQKGKLGDYVDAEEDVLLHSNCGSPIKKQEKMFV